MMAKMSKKTSIVALLTLLFGYGCMRTAPIVLPDGSNGFSISCAAGWNVCYQRAGKSCPHGYNIVDKGKQRDLLIESTSLDFERFVVIKCNPKK